MIPKGIKKWPTEVESDTLPIIFNKPFEGVFDLEISISTSHIVREDIEVGVFVFYYINKERIFKFSTVSKFKFTNPLLEEATLQFAFGCMVSAIVDFNQKIVEHPSELTYKDGAKAQHPIPKFEECKPSILRIWKINLGMN